MAGLLSVFAEFEHEILRERIRAGFAEARSKERHLGARLCAGDWQFRNLVSGRSERIVLIKE
jgi:DNA invertase Pin-like site-specific DNA recombinase